MHVLSHGTVIRGSRLFATLQRGVILVLFVGLLLAPMVCATSSTEDAQTYRTLNATGDASPGDPNELARELRMAQLAVQSRLNGSSGKAYEAVEGSAEWGRLRAASARLRAIDLKRLNTAGKKIAFWIDVYNALVLDAIISFRVSGSVLDVRDFFQRARYNVGGYEFCLDDIEHGLLRGNRAPAEGKRPPFRPDDARLGFSVSEMDPRIHFALSCGAKSCPPISTYDPDKIDTQLDTAAKNFINGSDVQVEPKQKRVVLSQIFQWYAADFGPDRNDVMRFVARYLNDSSAKQFLETHLNSVSIRYSTYDWALAHKL
jgi:Protein of unknown function, DUF547